MTKSEANEVKAYAKMLGCQYQILIEPTRFYDTVAKYFGGLKERFPIEHRVKIGAGQWLEDKEIAIKVLDYMAEQGLI